jgi:hypothetical protein
LGVCEEDDKLMEKYELLLKKSKELHEGAKEKSEKPLNTNNKLKQNINFK